MKYDFDEIIDRTHTNSIKYEAGREEEPGLPEDFLPLWIADMDFACPPEVIKAMHERLDKRILGYSDIIDLEYQNAVGDWMQEHFVWKIQSETMRISAGVVPAISNLVQILTKAGEKVLIFTPSYGPFYSCITNNDRVPVLLPLIKEDQYYRIDYTEMKQVMEQEDVKLLIFCSPHNPTGRVWSTEELRKVYEICRELHVPVICDEIHEDLIRIGEVHTPLARLYPESDSIYTCTAPSKTFNMAGNHMANIFIPNEEARQIWDKKFYYNPNALSIAATQAAYTYGREWVQQLREYLDDNFRYVKAYLEKYMPEVKFEIPEGTYLAWIDMSGLGLSEQELKTKFIEEAGLFVEGSGMFVANAEQHVRVNLACPKSVVKEFLDRMRKVFVE